MRGVRDGETERMEQDIVMRFKYKVREISKDDMFVEDIVDLGEAEIIEAALPQPIAHHVRPPTGNAQAHVQGSQGGGGEDHAEHPGGRGRGGGGRGARRH